MLAGPSAVFNKLLNLEVPLRSKGFMRLSSGGKKHYPPGYPSARNRGSIRQCKHRVSDGHTMKYLRPRRGEGGEAGACGFLSFGVELDAIQLTLSDLKSKTEK